MECWIIRAGVNPTDWKFRAGGMGELAFPEIVPGQDGAGVIDAVGPVRRSLGGDRVWTMLAQHTRPGGTAQEYVVLPVANVAVLLDAASYDVGALGVPAVTAHRALTTSEVGPDRLSPGALAGMTVLVAGGAGAVGNAAIQLARWAGATVLSTVSSADKAASPRPPGRAPRGEPRRARHAGGDPRAGARRGRHRRRGGPRAEPAARPPVIKPGGTIAIYANNGGDEVTLSVRETFTTNARFQWVLLYTVGQRRCVQRPRTSPRRSRTVRSAWETTTACRSTTTRSSRPPTRTRRWRTALSARSCSTLPTRDHGGVRSRV